MADLTEYQKWLEEQGLERDGFFHGYPMYGRRAFFREGAPYRQYRDEAIRRFGFAILTGAAVEALRPYGPFLEVGAGSGYWTFELARRGVACIATDPDPYSCVAAEIEKPWCEVEKLDAEAALAKYPGRTLLTVWPSLGQDWCAAALEKHAQAGGELFAHVGEGDGGCTGNARLFELLEADWALEREIDLPQWEGIHDYLEVYRRK